MAATVVNDVAVGLGENAEDNLSARDLARAIFEESGEFPPGRWQYLCHARKTWVDVADSEDADLTRSYLEAQERPRVAYTVNSVPFEVDLALMRRKNLASGRSQELRYNGILPFDLPVPTSVEDDAPRLGDGDALFAAHRATEAAGLAAQEACERLATSLDAHDAAAALVELQALVQLLDWSLSYERCVELRLGRLAGRSQKELEDAKAREVANTIVKKIFKLSQGGTARLWTDPIK